VSDAAKAKKRLKEVEERIKGELKEGKEKAKKEVEEAKERAKREAGEAKRAKEAEVKAKKEAELAARERAVREAEEAKRAKEAEAKARKEAELAARERVVREAEEAKGRAKREAEEAKRAKEAEAKAKKETGEKVSAELYEGMVELVILPPVDPEQMKKLEEGLRQVQDLGVVLVGGSVDEGTRVIVSAKKPIPLANVVGEIPLVEQVVKKGKEVHISLKAKP